MSRCSYLKQNRAHLNFVVVSGELSLMPMYKYFCCTSYENATDDPYIQTTRSELAGFQKCTARMSNLLFLSLIGWSLPFLRAAGENITVLSHGTEGVR